MHLQLARGRFISDIDVQQRANVCVLAAEAAALFFPTEDALGKVIRIRELPYVVIGVMQPKNPTAGIGGSISAQDFAKDIYIPLTTFWQRIGDRVLFVQSGQRTGEEVELSQITFQLESSDQAPATADAIRRTMQNLHNEKDYAVVVSLELLEHAKTTRLMFMVFMGMIAAVTLIVGDI